MNMTVITVDIHVANRILNFVAEVWLDVEALGEGLQGYCMASGVRRMA